MDDVDKKKVANWIKAEGAMNKLELIKKLRNECQISKKEAAAVVDLFLMKWPMRLQRVTGLKFGDCVLFM